MELPKKLGLSTNFQVLTGVLLAGFLVAGMCILTYRATEELVSGTERVSQSFEVLSIVRKIEAQALDAENHFRGFLISQDPELLLSSVRLEEELDQLINSLAERISPSLTDSHKNIAGIRSLVAARRGLFQDSADLEGRVAPERVRTTVARGQHLWERIRGEIEQIEANEYHLLTHRFEEARHARFKALSLFSALVILLLSVLLAVYHKVRNDINALTRTERDLLRSRERFELAVQGSTDGLWDWDILTNEVFFSPRWKEMLGYEDHEIPGRFEEWESRIHPEDRQRALATVEGYFSGNTTEYQLEHRLRHKDGTYRWILARGVALRDSSGRPYRMAGSHIDLTNRKETERLLAEQNRQLEQAAVSERRALEDLQAAQARLVQAETLATLGQLVAGVAHEINNPLAYVLNNIAVLKRDVASIFRLVAKYQSADEVISRERPDIAAGLQLIREEVDTPYILSELGSLIDRTREGLARIRKIVDDLRLFARLDEGDVQEADLNDGIQSTATIIRGNANNRGVAIQLDLSPLPNVRCNAARINQVVLNLLSNAIDACEQGDTVTVLTRASDNNTITIEVHDTGSGIPPNILSRIFDPFYTTKPPGQGTGLGLSISYGIIRDHNGTIEVRSVPGEGTTFAVHLPHGLVKGKPAPVNNGVSVAT